MILSIGLFSLAFVILILAVMDRVLGATDNTVVARKRIKKLLQEQTSTETNKVRFKMPQGRQQTLLVVGMSIAIFLFCQFFLRSTLYALLFSLGSFMYPAYIQKVHAKKRKELLSAQFKEAMNSVSNSLKAGNSLQTAIERCSDDMKRMFRYQKENPLIEEWNCMISDLRVGLPLERALVSFRDRCSLEEVDTFVNSAIIIKDKGGNMTEILGSVADTISDRIEARRNILALTAGKRSEAKMLSVMPIGLVCLLFLFSPSYMEPMYTKPLGKFLAALGLGMLVINYFVGRKIIDVEL